VLAYQYQPPPVSAATEKQAMILLRLVLGSQFMGFPFLWGVITLDTSYGSRVFAPGEKKAPGWPTLFSKALFLRRKLRLSGRRWRPAQELGETAPFLRGQVFDGIFDHLGQFFGHLGP